MRPFYQPNPEDREAQEADEAYRALVNRWIEDCTGAYPDEATREWLRQRLMRWLSCATEKREESNQEPSRKWGDTDNAVFSALPNSRRSP